MSKYEKTIPFKESRFSTHEVSVSVIMGNRIYLKGFENDSKRLETELACFPVESISCVEETEFRGIKAVALSGITQYEQFKRIYLPGFELSEINQVIETVKMKKRAEDAIEDAKRKKEEEKERLLELERLAEQKVHDDYFKTQYLDLKNNGAVYVFEEKEQFATFMYIDSDKNMMIRSVDKEKMETVSSVIQYKDIHYYEKAGAIHYVSNINISEVNQSFAGSFVPGKFHFTPAIVGGLLFGPMGLAVGAMIGYEPAHFEDIQQQKIEPRRFSSSHTHKIDDRSVMLNYYSEKYKQYMDIELPQEIYNFLQTHLAEKKYDIVLAVEKQKYSGALDKNDTPMITGSEPKAIEKKEKLSLEDFEIAVKKLKIMYENDLINEEEFKAKKKEFFDSIL